MKKKMVFGAVLVALLVLQVQTVFAADDANDFKNAVQKNDFRKAENILKSRSARNWNITEQRRAWNYTVLFNDYCNSSSGLRAAQLLKQYNISFSDNLVSFALMDKRSEELVRYVIDIGMPLGNAAVYWAINNEYSDNIVQQLLGKGAALDGEDLRKAVEKKRWQIVPLLVNRLGEDDMSYRQTRAEYTTWYNSQDADYRSKVPLNYDSTRSKTALMFAAEYGHRSTVRLLVEHGARVNLRADGGETAASLAYDNGEIEIYNYLKENGAMDFEPLQRQVTQQSTAPAQSTTNVYVQPSAPAQPAPAPVPSRPTLRPGRYACSGTNVTMEIQSPLLFVSLYSGNSVVGNGSYSISGNTITITIAQTNDAFKHMRGITYAYTIMSDTSFSGSGETWHRR
jgi:hypothetical protein